MQVDSLPAELQGKPNSTGVDSLSLLQGMFLTQESNQGLLHCRQILSHLSYQVSNFISCENDMKFKCQCAQPQFCPVHGSWLLLRYRSLVAQLLWRLDGLQSLNTYPLALCRKSFSTLGLEKGNVLHTVHSPYRVYLLDTVLI